jgi:hypothetical protein
MPRFALMAFALAVLLLAGPGRVEADAVISLGTRIPIDANTFAVPIEVSGAVELISWSVGLSYDPTDVQINTECDRFSGDPFCSLLTGPFTEGDFFAGGAPFNLLVPGVVALDPSTSVQTGVMFGFHGAFGGSPPGPSGDGTLAFVEFVVIGDGTSDITVTDPETTSSAIPAPATLALLAAGLVLLGMRWVGLGRQRHLDS